MAKIILLNGCSSAGKSSVARSIQYLSNQDWLTFGIDTFIGMLPLTTHDGRTNNFLTFVPGKNERGPTMRVETSPQGDHFFQSLPLFASLLADQGHNLIMDIVLWDDASLVSYADLLAQHTVYSIGILCDLSTMQEREILRGDRHAGLANDQVDRFQTAYDLEVNTTHLSPFEAARTILHYVETTPHPQRFEQMRAQKES